MVKNPPDGYQRVIPYLLYADAPAALEFLAKAFGFVERFRMAMPDGDIGHAEMALGDNVIMLASAVASNKHASPKDLPAVHALTLCYVNDVDAHHETARAAGATITHEPEDKFYGDRSYNALDPEGHQWTFATHVRDVPHEDLHPPEA